MANSLFNITTADLSNTGLTPSSGFFYLGVDSADNTFKIKKSNGSLINLEVTTDNFVPYTGATENINLNANEINNVAKLTIGGLSGSSSAILDLQSTTNGLLIPRMTTAQRLAISTPTPSLIIYDTDLNDLVQYDNSSSIPDWVSFGAKGLMVQQNAIFDIQVPSGYTFITIGPDPILSGISGDGTYINITGNQDEVLKFNANGYPTTSNMEIHFDGSINTPTLDCTPLSATTGDWWFEEHSGVTYLARKNSLGDIQKVELT